MVKDCLAVAKEKDNTLWLPDKDNGHSTECVIKMLNAEALNIIRSRIFPSRWVGLETICDKPCSIQNYRKHSLEHPSAEEVSQLILGRLKSPSNIKGLDDVI
jgi:hypothetical protein